MIHPVAAPRDCDPLVQQAAQARDETCAVKPLERTSEWEAGELPETYPWAV
jgi:hypothetical protein